MKSSLMRAATLGLCLSVMACKVISMSEAGELNPTDKVVLAMGHGSGVAISSHFVITAGHVVKDEKIIVVKTPDKKEHKAYVVKADYKLDVALLFVADTLVSSPLSCEPLAVGDGIEYVGNPLDLENFHSWGRVGSTVQEIGYWPQVQGADAVAAPGMSGGPVYDSQNNVRGIVVGGSGALSLFVPGETICTVLKGE